jgi:DNA-binding transcriptional LysR family regulator
MFNNIRHLRFVVAVARAKSLQEAARDMLISESALSMAIKAIEEEIGYSIFVRRPAKALMLTQAGIDFVAEASAFLDHVEAFQNRVVGLGNQLAGTVRLAAASSFAAVVLPPVLQAVRAEYPSIDVQVADYDIVELLQHLREGDVDMAITYDFVHEADVEMRQLVEVTPYIGVSPMAEHAEGDTVSLAEFAKRPLLLVDQPVSKQHVLQLFTRLGLKPRIDMAPRSARLLCSLVADDFGYGIFFLRSHRKMHDEPVILPLHISEAVDRHNLALALPRRRAMTARGKVVSEIIERTLRTIGPAIVFSHDDGMRDMASA